MNEETFPSAPDNPALRAPTLSERLNHIFGVHAWEPVGDEASTRVQCTGCKQVRHIGGRPVFDDDLEELLRHDDAEAGIDDDPAPLRFEPEEESPYGFDRRTTAAPPRERGEEEESGAASAWKWISGLQWWVKIWLLFILVQIIGFVISLFT